MSKPIVCKPLFILSGLTFQPLAEFARPDSGVRILSRRSQKRRGIDVPKVPSRVLLQTATSWLASKAAPRPRTDFLF
jgi:hypothetical protein